MTRLASIIAGLLILWTAGTRAAPIGPYEVPNLDAAVFKVRAEGARGVVNNGSAVLIAPGKLVTTCHVTRMAQGIQLSRGGETSRFRERSTFHALVTNSFCAQRVGPTRT